MKIAIYILSILFLIDIDALTQSNNNSILNAQIQGEWKSEKSDSVALIFSDMGFCYWHPKILGYEGYWVEGNIIYATHYDDHNSNWVLVSDSIPVLTDSMRYSNAYISIERKNKVIQRPYQNLGLVKIRRYKKYSITFPTLYTTYTPVFIVVKKGDRIILKSFEKKHGLFRTRYKKE